MTRRNEFDAYRYLRKTQNLDVPKRRSDDMNYQPLWYAVVIVAVLLALWWTR